MIDKLRRLWAAVLVVAAAAPAWGAAAVGVLTAVATLVVPLLPGPWQVRVGAWIGTAIVAVRAVVRAVSKVTPTPAGTEGLFVPEGKVIDVTARQASRPVTVNVRGNLTPQAADAVARAFRRRRPPGL